MLMTKERMFMRRLIPDVDDQGEDGNEKVAGTRAAQGQRLRSCTKTPISKSKQETKL